MVLNNSAMLFMSYKWPVCGCSEGTVGRQVDAMAGNTVNIQGTGVLGVRGGLGHRC